MGAGTVSAGAMVANTDRLDPRRFDPCVFSPPITGTSTTICPHPWSLSPLPWKGWATSGALGVVKGQAEAFGELPVVAVQEFPSVIRFVPG